MDADLLERDRVQSIVGGFYAVYNYYRYGLNEAVYAGALEIELTKRGHRVAREVAVSVSYRGQHVAWQRLDMVVDDAVIVETKATEKLSPNAKPQLLNYLRAGPFQVGLLLHFGPSATFYKLIDSPKRRHGSIEVNPSGPCPRILAPDSAHERPDDREPQDTRASTPR